MPDITVSDGSRAKVIMHVGDLDLTALPQTDGSLGLSDEIDRDWAFTMRKPPVADGPAPKAVVADLDGAPRRGTWYVFASRYEGWLGVAAKAGASGPPTALAEDAYRGWWISVGRPSEKALDTYPTGDEFALDAATVAPFVAACVADLAAGAAGLPEDVRVCPGSGGAFKAASAKVLAAALRAALGVEADAVECQDEDEDAERSVLRLVLKRGKETLGWQAMGNVLAYRHGVAERELPGADTSRRPSLPQCYPTLSVTHLRRIFGAAAAFYDAAPWESLGPLEPLLVTVPSRAEPYCCLVSGGEGDDGSRGLFAYDSLDAWKSRSPVCDVLLFQKPAAASFGTLDDVHELKLPMGRGRGATTPLWYRKTAEAPQDASVETAARLWARPPPLAALDGLGDACRAVAAFSREAAVCDRDAATGAFRINVARVRIYVETGAVCYVRARPAGEHAPSETEGLSLGYADRCAHCNARASAKLKLVRCARCATARYCGRRCQAGDHARHRKDCALMSEERARLSEAA